MYELRANGVSSQSAWAYGCCKDMSHAVLDIYTSNLNLAGVALPSSYSLRGSRWSCHADPPVSDRADLIVRSCCCVV